jgi:hypothetical protein
MSTDENTTLDVKVTGGEAHSIETNDQQDDTAEETSEVIENVDAPEGHQPDATIKHIPDDVKEKITPKNVFLDDDDEDNDVKSAVEEGGALLESDSEEEEEAEEGEDEEVPLSEMPLDAEVEKEEFVLELYQKKCLRCSHLVDFAEEKFTKCHYTQGNDRCPAQSIVITASINVGVPVRQFLAAEAEGDAPTLSKLYLRLGKQDPWIQQKILKALAEAREERGG